MDSSTVLAVLMSAGISSVATFIATRHQMTKRIANLKDDSDDLLALRLKHEYARGVEDGRREELGKFTVTYQPISEINEEWMGMKKRARLGYEMQINYNGFAVGHQTRHITHNSVEYNQENIDRILNSEVATAISSVAQLIATKGMNAKTLPRKDL